MPNLPDEVLQGGVWKMFSAPDRGLPISARVTGCWRSRHSSRLLGYRPDAGAANPSGGQAE
eukprot:4850650-Alexandrium_andersonii.AAC.1